MKLGRIIFLLILLIIFLATGYTALQFDLNSIERNSLGTFSFSIVILLACIVIINPNFFFKGHIIGTRIVGILWIIVSICWIFALWRFAL